MKFLFPDVDVDGIVRPRLPPHYHLSEANPENSEDEEGEGRARSA